MKHIIEILAVVLILWSAGYVIRQMIGQLRGKCSNSCKRCRNCNNCFKNGRERE